MPKEMDVNSPWPNIRGAMLLCENCHEENSVAWKMIYLAQRPPSRRLTRGQETLLEDTIQFHEKEHPGHNVHRFNLKKLD